MPRTRARIALAILTLRPSPSCCTRSAPRTSTAADLPARLRAGL